MELRAITKNERTRLSEVMISSTRPSAKYSCSGSPLMLVKGSTAIDGLSGSGKGLGAAKHGDIRGRDFPEAGDRVHADRLRDVLDVVAPEIDDAMRQQLVDVLEGRR